MLGDQRLQLADELAVPAERQLGLDPLLQRGQPQRVEPPTLHPCERLREVRERGAAPEPQRFPQQRRGASGRLPCASATSRSNRDESTSSGSIASR